MMETLTNNAPKFVLPTNNMQGELRLDGILTENYLCSSDPANTDPRKLVVVEKATFMALGKIAVAALKAVSSYERASALAAEIRKAGSIGSDAIDEIIMHEAAMIDIVARFVEMPASKPKPVVEESN